VARKKPKPGKAARDPLSTKAAALYRLFTRGPRRWYELRMHGFTDDDLWKAGKEIVDKTGRRIGICDELGMGFYHPEPTEWLQQGKDEWVRMNGEW
jgi:hypothetical protein